MCVNDAAVMKAWAENQGVGEDGSGTIVNFLGDPHGRFTDAMDLRMDHKGPGEIFGHGPLARSKRYSAYFVDGVLKVLNIAENGPGGPENVTCEDPAGDDYPENSLVEKMLEDIKKLA